MNFLHPFYLIVSGPSQSGKTTWVLNLLSNDLISPRPSYILYYYNHWQSQFQDAEGVVFVKGLPMQFKFLEAIKGNKLIILDDFLGDKNAEALVEELSTKGVHHTNTSLIQ